MKKFERIFSSMIAMIMMVAVGSVFTSCTNDDEGFGDKPSGGTVVVQECFSLGNLPPVVVKKNGENGTYLSFSSKKLLKQYEDFIGSQIKMNDVSSLLSNYKTVDMIPLYYSKNDKLSLGIYYDGISSLLLNDRGVIEIEDKIFHDNGNNYVPIPIRTTRSAYYEGEHTDGSVGGVEGTNPVGGSNGYYSFKGFGYIKYTKPLWSSTYRLTIETESHGNGGTYDYPLACTHSHYYTFDLIVDGDYKSSSGSTETGYNKTEFETLVASGENFQWGYCYATVHVGPAEIYLRME